MLSHIFTGLLPHYNLFPLVFLILTILLIQVGTAWVLLTHTKNLVGAEQLDDKYNIFFIY